MLLEDSMESLEQIPYKKISTPLAHEDSVRREEVQEISEELSLFSMGKIVKRALETVAGLPHLSKALFDLQAEMLPRMKSRRQIFTPSEETLVAFKTADAIPHVISLARSHSWYPTALPEGCDGRCETFKIDDMRKEAAKQLQIRQGITPRDDQFEVASFSTMTLLSAVIRTLKSGTAILGDTVAWEGYAISSAMEKHAFMAKPENQSWHDYIAENFSNPKEEIGAICITSPDSITGRYTPPAVLRELFSIANEYGIKIVLNQVHALPGRDGKFPETQRLIAESNNPNLFLTASATKQMMPYGVPGLESSMFNIFYSPNSDFIARTREEIVKVPAANLKGQVVEPSVIGPATELMQASTVAFYAEHEEKSFEKRQLVQDWISKHQGVNWYKGHMPDTMYNGTLTFSRDLIEKTGIKNPTDLYDYILFTTGLDVGPIYEAEPDKTNAEGGVSMRMNYSLPDSELRLALNLLSVAVDNMVKGITLARVIQNAKRSGPVRLRAEKTE